MDWADRIVRLRAARGWKQAALAELMGVDQATVSRWERGLQSPDVASRRRLARLFQREHPPGDRAALLAVEASPHPFLAFAGDLAVVAASPSVGDFFGIGLAELRAGGMAQLLSGDLAEALARAEAAGIWVGAVAGVSFVARVARHGEVRPARFLWTPVILSQGEVVVASQCGAIDEREFAAAGGIRELSIIDRLDAAAREFSDLGATPA